MKLILIALLMITTINSKLSTSQFEIVFTGVTMTADLLNNKNIIVQDSKLLTDFTKVQIDIKAKNNEHKLRSIFTCDMQKEHVNIELVKNKQRETINVKLVPGKTASFYIEDFPLDKMKGDENNCTVVVN